MDINRVRGLQNTFARVEHRLKQIEHNADGRLNVPCVNQLRYVAYHLLHYVVDGEESEIAEAEGHCARALYDSYEVEALFYLNTFRQFQRDYSDVSVSECVGPYLEWCQAQERVADFIRTHSQSTGRGAYYDAFVPHIDALQKINALLPHAREELNKKRRRYKAQQRWTVAGIGIGIVFGIVGIFSSIFPEYAKAAWGRVTGTPIIQSTK